MATFTAGKTTDGTGSSLSSADKIAVSSAIAGDTGTLTSGATRVWLSAAGSSATKMVVYADSGGAPGSLLATSGEVTITNTSEQEIAYTFTAGNQITITSGVTYWIGLFWQDPGTPSVTISRDATASGRLEILTAYPTPPSPFGTGTAQSGPMDAYITVDASGVGGSRPTLATRRDYLFTSGGATLKQGYWSNGDLTVTDTTVTDVVFVIHGTDRNADDYVTYGMAAATQAGLDNRTSVLVVAPHFIADTDAGVSTTSDWLYWSESGWKDGNLSQSDTYARPFRVGSYAALDSMILKAQASYPNLARVRVIGHSAGGQYVNRYAATSPVTDSLSGTIDIRFVIASPSSYLYMDSRRPHAPGGGLPGTTATPTFSTLTSGESTACPGYDTYKYGLAAGLNSYVSASTNSAIQARYQGRRVTYLVGASDNADTNSLDVTCEANWQGAYRIHRSANYFAYLAVFYGSTPTNHSRSVVAGVGHDGYAMITSAESRLALFSTSSTTTMPVVRSWSEQTTAAASMTTAKPTGLVAGDYLLALHGGDADVTSLTASGFSSLSSNAGSSTTNVPAATIWGKVATSGDAAASTFTFGQASSATIAASVILIAIQVGTYNPTTPISVIGAWTRSTRGNVGSGVSLQTIASIAGVANGEYFGLIATDTNQNAQTYPSTASGMTLVDFIQSAAGSGYSLITAYRQDLTVDGSTGSKTVTPVGTSTSNGWASVGLMVNPAPTASANTTRFLFAAAT